MSLKRPLIRRIWGEATAITERWRRVGWVDVLLVFGVVGALYGVTDLARPHAMSLPAVSKHLRVLEKAGLLRRRRYGRVHQLNLEAKPMRQAIRWIEEYRKFWDGSLDRLAAYLETAHKQSGKKGRK